MRAGVHDGRGLFVLRYAIVMRVDCLYNLVVARMLGDRSSDIAMNSICSQLMHYGEFEYVMPTGRYVVRTCSMGRSLTQS